MEVAEIYTLIAQSFVDSIPEEWEKAYMLIERQEGMTRFGVGRYTDDSAYLKLFKVKKAYPIVKAIDQLHAITTAGGNNRWNFLWFALSPGGAFEIKFIWSQDAQDQQAHLAGTRTLSWAERSDALGRLQLAQAEQASPGIYTALAQAVVALIPEAWATATVSVREAGMGISNTTPRTAPYRPTPKRSPTASPSPTAGTRYVP